jgi:hypothetical protein
VVAPTEALGMTLTVTSLEAELTHPLLSVPVTVYKVFEIGLTTILDVVGNPPPQLKLDAPVAVNVVVDPLQIVVFPEMEIIGNEFICNVKVSVFLHPLLLVPSTV